MAHQPNEPHPAISDGVYLNLPEEDYFGQDCLGSTDLIRLHQRKWGWWWSSRYNPERQQTPQDYFTYGSALHSILLEGVGAYEARFAAAPDKEAFDKLAVTIEDMQAAIREGGFALSGTSAWKAKDWRLAMRANLPGHPCWPNIVEDFEDSIGERRAIRGVDDRMLRLMREVAIDPARPDNDDIRKLFDDDHPPLAEVSIFWTEGGVRRRARIDRMFPAFDMDLKSLGNWSGRPLPWVTGEQIAKGGYDIQRADYWIARAKAMEFIREGQLFGGSIEQRKWLQTWPDEHQDWDWVWLFYQKPEPSGRAPVIFPVMDVTRIQTTPGEFRLSEVLEVGLLKRQGALQFYRSTVAEFGLDRPWARVETLHYTDEAYTPRVFLPPWISETEPTIPGAYDGDDEHER